MMFLHIRTAGTLIPLHYTIYFGFDLTSTGWWVWQLPLISTASWLVHGIGTMAYSDIIWRRSWLLFGLAVQLLWGTATAALYLVQH